MAKSVRRRRHASALRDSISRPDAARTPDGRPARRDPQDPGRLLDRILDTPHLAHVVPRLRPELLHRVIQSCGLEDCGELVALATPEQLARIFDLDLWHSARPGMDEQFDANRFGVWLEVLVASGVGVAAYKLAGLDVDLVIAGLAQHARVFDLAAVTSYTTTDGEEVTPTGAGDAAFECDVGGYRLVARRTDAWDAIVAVLMSLEAERHEYFDQVMRGCRMVSHSTPEVDGLDDLLGDGDQAMFDLAVDRERRREKHGFVTPAQAAAFLEISRRVRPGLDTEPSSNPIVRAYFRGIDGTAEPETKSARGRVPAEPDPPTAPDGTAEAVAEVMHVVLEAGILAQPLALLDQPESPLHKSYGGRVWLPRLALQPGLNSKTRPANRNFATGSNEHAPRLARIRAHMQFVRDSDRTAYSIRSEELAYLANTIIAACSIQNRSFTAQEASDAAVAVCNLGLENWPPHWIQRHARRPSSGAAVGMSLPDDFLVGHDLVSVFQVGWTVLHDDVSMSTAEELIAVLTRLQCDDREIQVGLAALRTELTRHWRAGAPWRARGALEVIAILDGLAWAALLGLIDQCPVIHGAIGASQDRRTHTVSAAAFEFISENSQIGSVRAFMRSLPELLGH